MAGRANVACLYRMSGPSDSLAPPPSPYPQQIEPSPVDSNGTESTEIDEEAQDDPGVKPSATSANGDVQSPDVEITSPQSANSVCTHTLRRRGRIYPGGGADTCGLGPATAAEHALAEPGPVGFGQR